MPERVKKKKCEWGGGVLRKEKLGEGYSGEGKEDKMWGVAKKIEGEGGMPERVKKMKCGGGGGAG